MSLSALSFALASLLVSNDPLPISEPGVAQALVSDPVLRQVTVDASHGPKLVLTRLLSGGFDVLHTHASGMAYDVLCDDAELERLGDLGLRYELVHDDLARFYEERLAAESVTTTPRLGAWLSPPFGQGALGGYYSFAEVASVLEQIANAYPDIVSPRTSIGTTHQGRPIWMVKVSDNVGTDENEPEVRFDAMHHAREPESMQATLWTLLHLVENYGTDALATSIVDEREIWFLPVVNPDGYVRNQQTNPGGGGLWRKNRRVNGNGTFGVDLNRNYPFQWGVDGVGSSGAASSDTYRGPGPGSEPETQAMMAFLSSRDFVTALSTHCYSDVWLYPWGYVASGPANFLDYREISKHVTIENGYPFGAASVLLYLANGVTIDYDHGVHGTYSWTPEIGSAADGFWPPQSRIVPLAEDNLTAFLRTALAAGAHPVVSDARVVDAGDGDGYYEEGERFELTFDLRNGGLAATSGNITLTLSSSSPYLTIEDASANLPPLASFADVDGSAFPLAFRLASDVPDGTDIRYELEVAWDGLREVESYTFSAGRDVTILHDDVEDDLGWTLGAPGDTATTGIWVWGNPRQTILAPDVFGSPEDDATPGAGKRCLITGNASTVVNFDDVDNGFTTLISPPFDLSGFAFARLSYQRWFGDLNVADDVLEVSVSDDDGASWVALESLTQPNYAWEEIAFKLHEFIALTDSVRVRFVLADSPDNSIAEAHVDELRIEAYEAVPNLHVLGRPRIGGDVAFHVTSIEGGTHGIFESTGTGLFPFALIQGPLLLDPLSLVLITQGTIGASGTDRQVLEIPDDPTLVGRTLYYQALVSAPGGLYLSGRRSLTFE